MTDRLLQWRGTDGVCRVIVARGEQAAFVDQAETVLSLAARALGSGQSLLATIESLGTDADVDIAAELAAGRIIAPIDHRDPAHMVCAGTGLTHLGSAEGRDRMHKAAAAGNPTDSMRMFLEGVEGGKPAAGQIGQQPEWFYKCDGTGIVGPGETFQSPSFAQDGSEEPELAGIYLIGDDGMPYRIGFTLANEFSDHVTERHNYLWLAHSKLRQASLGPELLIGALPNDVRGTSRILRDGAILWEKPFLSGHANMSHTIANLEHHHFKYPQFRQPGDVHVHFYGTATLSFSDAVTVRIGDVFEIEAAPFTLPLRNGISVDPTGFGAREPVVVRAL